VSRKIELAKLNGKIEQAKSKANSGLQLVVPTQILVRLIATRRPAFRTSKLRQQREQHSACVPFASRTRTTLAVSAVSAVTVSPVTPARCESVLMQNKRMRSRAVRALELGWRLVIK